MNEPIEKSWWQRNKKHAIGFGLILIVGSLLLSISGLTDNASNYMGVYMQPKVYKDALAKANKNNQVIAFFGNLEPIDNLAIVEGNILFTQNDSVLEMNVRVIGAKTKGKLHFIAQKDGENWLYKKIEVTDKKSGKVILIP